MVALRRKQNYRNIVLRDYYEGERVGVLLRDGSLQYVKWLGFVELDEAKQRPYSRPVKVSIHSIQQTTEWVTLSDGEYVQGCLTVGEGVRGVLIDGVVRVIS